MESKILLNSNIQKYINDSLVFINLFVDEKTELNKNEKYFSKLLNKNVKTIGNKRLEIEVKYYNLNLQPFFVLLGIDGKEIARISYTLDINKFEQFLKNKKEAVSKGFCIRVGICKNFQIRYSQWLILTFETASFYVYF